MGWPDSLAVSDSPLCRLFSQGEGGKVARERAEGEEEQSEGNPQQSVEQSCLSYSLGELRLVRELLRGCVTLLSHCYCATILYYCWLQRKDRFKALDGLMDRNLRTMDSWTATSA